VAFQSQRTSETVRIGKSMGRLLLPGDVIALAVNWDRERLN